MAELTLHAYDRDAAVDYARQWAFKRNPQYYNFDGLGGDCTNFASQCVYAGAGIMNFASNGWYYLRLNRRAPAWTSVMSLYDFLTKNKGVGPQGHEIGMADIQPGDLVQLMFDDSGIYRHTPVIVSVGRIPGLHNVRVAAHADDCLDRPLSDYRFTQIRFIHIASVQTVAQQ